MKIQNEPAAYGVLAGLLVLLLGLVANAGCAHYPDPALAEARAASTRAWASVEVITECGRGTGVLVGARRVITAFHVINCGDGDEVRLARAVVVRTLDKKSYVVVGGEGDPDRDIAALTLDADVPGVTPVTIRKAVLGEALCAFTSVPERAVRCGVVKDFDDAPRSWGDVQVREANYWYGNSGSGVYAADGSLVGILTRLNFCSQGDAFIAALGERVVTCGGRVSSLVDSTVNT